jgi:hypothetical protein
MGGQGTMTVFPANNPRPYTAVPKEQTVTLDSGYIKARNGHPASVAFLRHLPVFLGWALIGRAQMRASG